MKTINPRRIPLSQSQSKSTQHVMSFYFYRRFVIIQNVGVPFIIESQSCRNILYYHLSITDVQEATASLKHRPRFIAIISCKFIPKKYLSNNILCMIFTQKIENKIMSSQYVRRNKSENWSSGYFQDYLPELKTEWELYRRQQLARCARKLLRLPHTVLLRWWLQTNTSER